MLLLRCHLFREPTTWSDPVQIRQSRPLTAVQRQTWRSTPFRPWISWRRRRSRSSATAASGTGAEVWLNIQELLDTPAIGVATSLEADFSIHGSRCGVTTRIGTHLPCLLSNRVLARIADESLGLSGVEHVRPRLVNTFHVHETSR